MIGKYLAELDGRSGSGKRRQQARGNVTQRSSRSSSPRFLLSPPIALTYFDQDRIFSHTTSRMSRIKPALPKEPGRCPLPSRQSTDSFWHSEPSPLLTAHRSTRNLPEKADVVIIGSGMTGASVAHYLLNNESPSAGVDSNGQKKNLRVVMLEAREACWGATGRVRSPIAEHQASATCL